MSDTRCAADSCADAVSAGSPVRLCDGHLALAAEWAGRDFGAPDLLPAPCRLCGSPVGVRFPSGWVCAVCEWRHGEIPDDDVAPPRIDVVYYLRFGDRVKIGTTGNPKQRFAAIRHEDLLALEPGDRKMEQRRHVEFAADRLGSSEWFALSADIRAHVDALTASIGDPWDAYARWISAALARRG